MASSGGDPNTRKESNTASKVGIIFTCATLLYNLVYCLQTLSTLTAKGPEDVSAQDLDESLLSAELSPDEFPEGTELESDLEDKDARIPIDLKDLSLLDEDETDLSADDNEQSVLCEETSLIHTVATESSEQIEFNFSQLQSPHSKNCSIQAKGKIL